MFVYLFLLRLEDARVMKHWPRWQNASIPSIHWDAISEVLRNNSLHKGWCLSNVEFHWTRRLLSPKSVCYDQGSLWCNIGVQGVAQISCIFWQGNTVIFEIWIALVTKLVILVTFQVTRWQRQRWFWATPDFWRTRDSIDRLGRKGCSTLKCCF